ncbi:uncharacterized protein PRCAT00005938001 [Priceomyces carsonii]|nr:unnamed protein product [Priceomyces carsonii]
MRMATNIYRCPKNLLQDLLCPKETIRVCSFGCRIKVSW